MFGRSNGDKRLAAQKAALADCRARFTVLDRAVTSIDTLRSGFARVWPVGGPPDDLLAKVAKARELIGMLDERVAMARGELPNFDEAVAMLAHNLPLLHEAWQEFLALLITRETILSGRDTAVRWTSAPSIVDCQRALLDLADALHRELRTAIDELSVIRPNFDDRDWPNRLDLPAMERGLRDASGAIHVYRDRLETGNDELTRRSTVTLLELIQMLQGSIAEIADVRPQLAITQLSRAMLGHPG